MSLINEDSGVVSHPLLDLFEQYPVQVGIESTKIYRYTPYAQLNSGSNYEIKIASCANEFIPLDQVKLRLRLRVKLAKSDGTAVVAGDWEKVSVVNNFLHSLWSQIDVKMGDTPLTSSLQTYPYLAYLQTIFETPKLQQDTTKVFAGYTEDTMSTAAKDTPVKSRSDMIKASAAPFDTGRLVCLQDSLYADPFNINSCMIGNTEITVVLIPSKPEFLFMTSDTKLIPSIEFTEIQLVVPKHRINGNVMAGLYTRLHNTMAKYPYERREPRSFTIETGTISKTIDNMIIGQMPQKLFIMFPSNQAMSGSFTKNPFYFANHGIEYLQCNINGEPVRTDPFQPDFENNIIDDEYLEFMRISGNLNNHPMTTITPSKWQYGYTIFAFDPTQDQSANFDQTGYLNMRKDGILSVNVRFKSALTETINCLVFGKFANQYGIDEYRNIYMDKV